MKDNAVTSDALRAFLEEQDQCIYTTLHDMLHQRQNTYRNLEYAQKHQLLHHIVAGITLALRQNNAPLLLQLGNSLAKHYPSIISPYSFVLLLHRVLFTVLRKAFFVNPEQTKPVWETLEAILDEALWLENSQHYTCCKNQKQDFPLHKQQYNNGQELVAKHEAELQTVRQQEEELRLSEAMYQALFEKNMAVKLLLDPKDGKIVDANSAACSFYGYTREAMQTLHISDINTLSREEVAELMQHAASSQKLAFQFQHKTRSGEIRMVEVYSGPILIRGRTLLISIVHDVTDRQRMEAELRNSEARYRAIVEDQTDCICRFLPDGTLTFVNDAYCRHVGKTREELLSSPAYLFSQNGKQADYLATFNIHHPVATSEHQIVTEAGEVRWQQWTDRAIFNAEGHIVEFQSVGCDITYRVQAEKALQVQRDLAFALSSTSDLHEVLDHILDVVVQIEGIDCGGIYLVNRADQSLYLFIHKGLSPEFAEQVAFFTKDSLYSQFVLRGNTYYGTFADVQQRFEAIPNPDGLQALAILPVRHEGRVMATLYFASHNYDHIPRSSRSMVELLAAQVGGVIARVRAEEALRDSQGNLQRLFDTLDDYLFIFDTDCHILHFNPVVAYRLGYTNDELHHMRLQEVYDHTQCQAIEQALPTIARGETAVFTVPLLTKSGRAIAVETRVMQGTWNNADVLFGISRDITELKRAEESLRYANGKLQSTVSHLEQRNREITLMNEMGDHLQTCRSMSEAYRVIGQYAEQLFTGYFGVLYMLNHTRNIAQLATTWGDESIEAIPFSPNECWALHYGHMHCIQQTTPQLTCHHVIAPPSTSYICAPLIAQGEILGVLHVRNTPYNNSLLSERWSQLATTLAEHIALALANLSLREQLQYQSTHDALTGLFNRRYLEERIETELQRGIHNRHPIGIVMLDIDHFKQFNDVYGHKAGDVMLYEVGQFLVANIRGEDVVCRYGGEEFTIILPAASLEHTRKRAEQLAQGVRRLQIAYDGKLLGTVTLSFGVACFPKHGVTSESLIRAADVALYHAKDRGRDQVVVADSVLGLSELHMHC